MTDPVHDDEAAEAVSVLGMAKKMLADAESNAERVKNAALEEAHSEADQILQSAREEAERLVSDATSEVERIHRKSEDEIEQLKDRLEELRVFEQQYNAGLLELARSAAATLGVQLVEPHDDVEIPENHYAEYTTESPGFVEDNTPVVEETVDISPEDESQATEDDETTSEADGISFDLNDYIKNENDS